MNLQVLFSLACLLGCASAAMQQTVPEYVAQDFTAENLFTSGIEGPCVAEDGMLYIVNFAKKGTIGKVEANGSASHFVDLPEGSTGNGIRTDHNGTLYIADYTGHNVLAIDLASKTIKVHAHQPDMNQPNDLAIASDGTLYCSDPNWKEGSGQLWKVHTNGKTELLAADMGTTNGIELSPDESTLYVNESVQRKIWQFTLDEEGISKKRLLREFPDHGFDGMRCDAMGNLHVTRYGKGTVVVLSPNGQLLQEVQLKGKKPSNLAFGGPDGKTCYVTLQDRGSVETYRAAHPGRSFLMKN